MIGFCWAAVLTLLLIVWSDWRSKFPGAGWEATIGEVTSVDCRNRGGKRSGLSVGTEWHYRYEVEEVAYTAIYTADFCDRQNLFSLYMRRVGQPVEVWYDPSEPSRSVLEREPPFPWAHLIGVGLPLVTAVFITRGGWKDLRQHSARGPEGRSQ